MNYPGGKNGSGTFQRLINLIPPHEVYVEAFLGSGAIMRLKRPATSNIGIDADEDPLSNFPAEMPNLMLIKTDALDWLSRNTLSPKTFLYLDPPYLMSTRSTQQAYYRHEFTDEQHARLLAIVASLPCMVMLSGYYSEMYAQALAAWRTESFNVRTRSGRSATEWVWLNYPEPFALHDYRYLGEGYRQRESIKRKQGRWLANLQSMNSLERYAMLQTIDRWRSLSPSETASPAAGTVNNDMGTAPVEMAMLPGCDPWAQSSELAV